MPRGIPRLFIRGGRDCLIAGLGSQNSHTLKRGHHTKPVRSPAFRLGSCTVLQMYSFMVHTLGHICNSVQARLMEQADTGLRLTQRVRPTCQTD